MGSSAVTLFVDVTKSCSQRFRSCEIQRDYVTAGCDDVTHRDDVLDVDEPTVVEARGRQRRDMYDVVIERAVARPYLAAGNAEDITRVRATLTLSEIADNLWTMMYAPHQIRHIGNLRLLLKSRLIIIKQRQACR